MLSDAHCHLDGCPDDRLPGVVQRCRDAGLELIVTTGMNVESSARSAAIAAAHDIVYAAIGVHPWDAILLRDAELNRLRELARQPKVVAISEIGLDWVRGVQSRDVQMQAYGVQVALALELGLPLMIHCHEAYTETVAVLRAVGADRLRGCVHGFNGDAAHLQGWLDLGFWVSIGRRLLRPEGEPLLELVKRIPADRLLIETDSSARTPDDPGPEAVAAVAARLAELRGATAADIGRTATANLRELLRL